MLRLLRWCFNGLCLLSLLACAVGGWLGWTGARGGTAWVEAAALRTDAVLASGPRGLYVRAVGRWPGRPGAWVSADDAGTYPLFWCPSGAPPWLARQGEFAGIHWEAGRLRAHLGTDGAPDRLTESSMTGGTYDGSGPRWSEPLPYRAAGGIPLWLAPTAFAIGPLLWVALLARRRQVRRRRRRLGLCRRCGYDLTGNVSGACSECGTTVEAGRRVTA